jgi:hypothetical protein
VCDPREGEDMEGNERTEERAARRLHGREVKLRSRRDA